MMFKDIIAVCYKNHMKHINAFYKQNAELLCLIVSGT
jgi:hypothetical protein